MGARKQRKKLFKAQEEAQACLSREDAQKILHKAAKATRKLDVIEHRAS